MSLCSVPGVLVLFLLRMLLLRLTVVLLAVVLVWLVVSLVDMVLMLVMLFAVVVMCLLLSLMAELRVVYGVGAVRVAVIDGVGVCAVVNSGVHGGGVVDGDGVVGVCVGCGSVYMSGLC